MTYNRLYYGTCPYLQLSVLWYLPLLSLLYKALVTYEKLDATQRFLNNVCLLLKRPLIKKTNITPLLAHLPLSDSHFKRLTKQDSLIFITEACNNNLNGSVMKIWCPSLTHQHQWLRD